MSERTVKWLVSIIAVAGLFFTSTIDIRVTDDQAAVLLSATVTVSIADQLPAGIESLRIVELPLVAGR